MREWSNLAKIVYARTYSRVDTGVKENWQATLERAIGGNVRGHNVPEDEVKLLLRLGMERKAIPAGRGLWFSGSPAHAKIGGVALNNCWAIESSSWENFVLAQDLLMLGGGVGMSVEHRFVSKLPKVKKDVTVVHKATNDADFIVPDSREGWCELTRRTLESFFVTGRSFSYSSVCIRGYGEPIKGFGGVASGPISLIKYIDNLCTLLNPRAGKHIRPIDAADILCATGEMVVSGNVRRSAIIILGDAWDKEYLKCKRWDIETIPSYRSCANFSVVCDDVDDLHPLFWKTYEAGEPFGLVNRKNMQKYGRMGEERKDSAYLTNPCAEATLEHGEPCNLQELALMNIESEEEFTLAACAMTRYGIRVTMEDYRNESINSVVRRNRRVGTGITGCLGSPLFNAGTLDRVYDAIQVANRDYTSELGIPPSIRTTLVKPSGTVSKVLDQDGYEGIHPAFSRYMIQRVRFSASDRLIPLLREAGHTIEPEKRLDGSVNHGTLVVDFYAKAPDGLPVADEDWDTWKQLDTLMLAQTHWADQACSVTVYYRKHEMPAIKSWLADNLCRLKTISFLCHNDHGFLQAPKEAITSQQFDKLSSKVKPIDPERIGDGALEMVDCEGGACPIK